MVRNPNAVLPVGTKIVIQTKILDSSGEMLFAPGAVGIIIKAPLENNYPYRIRFVDGYEESLKRTQFEIHSHYQLQGIEEHETDVESLYDYVIYRCIIGSRAYGLDDENSDIDIRGIYIPPADLHWSIYGVPEQLENQETEEQYWEVQKFLILALKANPNILECLYTPLIRDTSPLAEELLAIREVFLSKLVYQTYNGYVLSQFRKLKKDIENYGEIRWKHAMHLIRLLLSGKIALKEHYIPVRVDDYRDALLTIKRGEMPWEEVDAWRLQLHREFDVAFASTTLSERPDYERASAFLIKARRSMVEKS
ncbi:MAG TPA: nucleotidyltransferase domain-containing protein [Aggregatilineales bacterium]|nr:nucleotidyltransferase domain-containing protein [Aggregatilineales bacterium]